MSLRFVIFLVVIGHVMSQAPYVYETLWTTQVLDHFNFGNSGTFQQRYLINDTWWTAPSPGMTAGPIFFYTGNEGDINLFAQNTGFMWEIAPEFNALVVFCEHRYYGETMPLGPASYDNGTTLQWLTSEQALADYALFLDSLKQNLSAVNVPVVSFGGSYGGMLSGWFRMKYPGSVVGAIAASAPVAQFTGVTAASAYSAVITNTFATANPAAPMAIYQSWSVMEQTSMEELADLYTLCSVPQNVSGVFNWLSNALQYMTMADYPYPADFLGPMPAWPVNQSAAPFHSKMDNQELILAMRGIAAVFYNSSGQAGSCFNISDLSPPGLKFNGWNYQACTEMIMPIGQYGPPNDMFFIAPWNLEDTITSCQQQYGVTPNPNWIIDEYGGRNMQGISNIVWSNGDLDPWSSGGVTQNTTGAPTSISYVINQGAHHLDLRSSNPADPMTVIEARNIHRQNIRNWIADFYNII